METKKFNIKDLKSEIVKTYGSFKNLKKFLKENAKYEYGCKSNEVFVYGCKIVYTDNSNCFASYFIRIPFVGFKGEYGLGKSAITKSGKSRGCSEMYINI